MTYIKLFNTIIQLNSFTNTTRGLYPASGLLFRVVLLLGKLVSPFCSVSLGVTPSVALTQMTDLIHWPPDVSVWGAFLPPEPKLLEIA